MENTKQYMKRNAETMKVIAVNLLELLDAVCLTIVSGFAIYQGRTNGSLKRMWADVLVFAGIVIALQAFVLLAKHFNKQPRIAHTYSTVKK